MPDLENSQRRLYKATYVPLSIPKQDQAPTGRAVEKIAYVRSLALQPDELRKLAADKTLRALTVPSLQPRGRPTQLTSLVTSLLSDPTGGPIQKYGPTFAKISIDNLVNLGHAVANLRSSAAVKTGTTQKQARNVKRVVASPATTSATDLQAAAAKAQQAAASLQYQGPIQSVGQINLERLEMTPVGVEHGELVHSVPLTPGETVNITHREWTVTTQTFESLISDSLTGFSETGVTEKTDLSQASDVESRHSSSLDVNGAISATYNGGSYSLTASAGVDYKSQSDSKQSEKDSKAHSMAITRNASTRTMKEHKTSFRVSSVAGSEDLAVQVITNPSQTDAMRVDYYQLLRKWRVDLIRYGLRMTYDLVVPNPGLELLDLVSQLNQLEAQLDEGFTFTLDPSEINVSTWQQLAQAFGSHVDAPPVDPLQQSQLGTVEQSLDKWSYGTVQFDVQDGYEVASGRFVGVFSLSDASSRHMQVNVLQEPAGTTNVIVAGKWQEFTGNDVLLDFPLTTGSIVGKTGAVFLTYEYHNVDSGSVTVSVNMSPTPQAMQAWVMKVWGQLRDAAQAQYEANANRMAALKAQLESKIAAFDSLTLRKMEREQIMKAVIQWLLGPSYDLMPRLIADVIEANATDPSTGKLQDLPSGSYAFPDVDKLPDATTWHEILDWGELIKFIHNAIEWENVLFFVYPYFWDYVRNWPFKRFLLHPDPVHREFLRAGCARVVLPVRPGFETSFAMLLETGDPTSPPDTSYPYVTIGEETRNLAMTNYENIPPANPDRNVRTLLYPPQRKAWAEMQSFMLALNAYFAATNTYPASLSDNPFLTWIQGNPDKLPSGFVLPADVDPWKNPYHYTYPGMNGDYDLVCYGADAAPGGDGLDADITSWAEGAVVGRWFEYTPTSALDLAVTMIAPDQPQAKLPTSPSPA